MLPRVLAGIASAGALLYLVAYVWIVRQQAGAVAWWYVALILVAASSLAVAALRGTNRVALIVGLVASSIGLVVGLLSIGVLLIPSVVAALIALLTAGGQPSHDRSIAARGPTRTG